MSGEFTLPFDHVSDTAWLVANFRLTESERKDRLFNDTLAGKLLAGKREQFQNSMPKGNHIGEWMMAVRTRVLDEMILKLVSHDVDMVINLAAGLDTRPYRLALPTSVQWVEVDFPGVIDYKRQCLSQDNPQCKLTRYSVDLSSDKERKDLFSQLGKECRRGLVLTEGLIYYLTEENVKALSRDLLGERSFLYWAMDVCTRDFFAWSREHWHNDTDKVGSVSFTFTPDNSVRFFENLGWNKLRFDSFLQAGTRLARPHPQNLTAGDHPSFQKAVTESGLALFKAR